MDPEKPLESTLEEIDAKVTCGGAPNGAMLSCNRLSCLLKGNGKPWETNGFEMFKRFIQYSNLKKRPNWCWWGADADDFFGPKMLVNLYLFLPGDVLTWALGLTLLSG